MECKVPTSDIIPPVAARLKYYLDVERKEAGFNVSIHQKETNEKYRLYQCAGSHAMHRTQRIKKTFLDNQIEASLQSYTGKSGAEWNQKMLINEKLKQQVQQKIKKKMSSLTMPDRFSNNHVYLRSINWKRSDWEGLSSDVSHCSPPDISHGELRRLIASAANLIVATTSGCPLQHLHQHRTESGLKTGLRQSQPSLCVTIPNSRQEHSSNTETLSVDEGSRTHRDESVDLGFKKNQTVPATSEDIDYEIVVRTGASSPTETKPSLFIRLVGENGRSKTHFLQNALANRTTSCDEKVAIFHVKAKDVGEVKHVIVGVDRKRPDAQNCQRRQKKMKPSSANTKLRDCKDTSPVITSRGLESSSCTHAEKMETAKKVNHDKVDVSKRSINKSIGSHRRPERIERKASQTKAIIQHGSPERKLEKVTSSEKRTLTVSSGKKSGTGKKESVQVTTLFDTQSNTITEDGSTDKCPHGDNIDNVIAKNMSTVGDLLIQNKIQTDGLTTPKYRRASSPASYVFFSHETKEESPLIVKVDGGAKRNTSSGSISGYTRRESYHGMKQMSYCSSADKKDDGCDGKASQLFLLQQIILEPGDNLTGIPPQPDSEPFSSNNAESTVDEDNEVHSVHAQVNGYTDSCCQLDREAAQTCSYCCSCGEHSSYESDSMLDGEYLFFDTSLDLSLSEDECETPLKSVNLGKEAEDNKEQDMRREANQHIYRHRRVDSCNENSNIFQSALAAIRSQDNIKLRNLCQSHFFLPSVTDEEGKTLLHHAASQENSSICQVLLDTNVGVVNIDQQDMFGKTALHHAVQNGNTKTIKLLLDNGAKPEIPDENSNTVLDIALWKIQTK